MSVFITATTILTKTWTVTVNSAAVLSAAANKTAAGNQGPAPDQVSPGFIGFLATFTIVVVSIFLFYNLSRRMRRLEYRRQQAAEELLAEVKSGGVSGAEEEKGNSKPGQQ